MGAEYLFQPKIIARNGLVLHFGTSLGGLSAQTLSRCALSLDTAGAAVRDLISSEARSLSEGLIITGAAPGSIRFRFDWNSPFGVLVLGVLSAVIANEINEALHPTPAPIIVIGDIQGDDFESTLSLSPDERLNLARAAQCDPKVRRAFGELLSALAEDQDVTSLGVAKSLRARKLECELPARDIPKIERALSIPIVSERVERLIPYPRQEVFLDSGFEHAPEYWALIWGEAKIVAKVADKSSLERLRREGRSLPKGTRLLVDLAVLSPVTDQKPESVKREFLISRIHSVGAH